MRELSCPRSASSTSNPNLTRNLPTTSRTALSSSTRSTVLVVSIICRVQWWSRVDEMLTGTKLILTVERPSWSQSTGVTDPWEATMGSADPRKPHDLIPYSCRDPSGFGLFEHRSRSSFSGGALARTRLSRCAREAARLVCGSGTGSPHRQPDCRTAHRGWRSSLEARTCVSRWSA